MELYIRIVKYSLFHSNWAIEEDQQLPGTSLPCDSTPNHAWAASALWLEELIRRQLWVPAKIFTKIIASVVPRDPALAMYKRLLVSLPAIGSDRPSALFVHIATYTAFGQYLGWKAIYDEATSAARSAEQLLVQAALQTNDDERFPRERIEYEFVLGDLATDSPIDKARHLNRAAAIANKHQDLVSEDRALSAILDVGEPASNRATLEKVSSRLEQIEGDLQPDLPSVLFQKQRLLGLTGHDDLGKLAEWFSLFEKGDPTSNIIHLIDVRSALPDSGAFDNPQALYYKASALSRIYMVLGNKSREDKARDEMDSLEAHLPQKARAAFGVDNVAVEWFGKTDRVFNVETGIRVLLGRMTHAWDRGTLTRDELRETVPDASIPNETNGPNEKVSLLKIVDTTNLRKALFGPPLRQDLWEMKLQRITGWLKRNTFWTTASSDLLIGALLYYRQLHHIDVEQNSQPYIQDQKQSVSAFTEYWPMFDPEVKDIYRLVYLRNRLMSIQCDYHLFLCEIPPWRATSMLMNARTQALELLDECDSPKILAQGDFIASMHLWIGKIEILLHANMHFSTEALFHLEQADRLHGRFRSEMSSIGGIDAQEIKKSWRETQFHNDAVLTQAVDHTKTDWMRTGAWGMKKRQDHIAQDMWNWIQRSKGRAIAEAVAMSNELPKKMVAKAAETDDHLLNTWQDVRKAISGVVEGVPGMGEKYRKRHELEDLERRMTAVPELDEVISVVNGKATTTTAMQSLMAELPEVERSKLVLVNWFLAQTVDGRDLNLIVLRHQGPPIFQRVEKGAMQKAEAWTEKYLTKGAIDSLSEDAFNEAQEAVGLVAPLATLTKPGDTIVLCPKGALHRFPLHCLKIKEAGGRQDEDYQILLQRNPVTYIHSMTLLHFCINSRMRTRQSAHGKTVAVTPLDQCLDSVTPIAELFSQVPLLDEEVTRSNIISACKDSDFLHFCGHVHASGPNNPLDAHLYLYNPDDEEGDAVCRGAHPPESQLTGAHIFQQVTFNEGTHINLIACESSVTYESAEDDMLGLIPLFFYAGARSVLGTLWSVAPYYAQEWTEAFARELAAAMDKASNDSPEQSTNSHETRTDLNLINLVECCRSASLTLMARTDESRMLRH